MSTAKLVGRKGLVEVVKIFSAISNTDMNSGSGNDIDETYHPTREEAEMAALDIGAMGSRGKVESRLVVRFEDGSMLLLANRDTIPWRTPIPAANAPIVNFSKPRPDLINLVKNGRARKKALAKLSPKERTLLSLR